VIRRAGSRRRGVLATLAAVALGLGGVGLRAAPASADDANPLLYSRDGVSWSTSPLPSIFPSGMTLVPGDVVTSTIHLQNNRTVTSSVLVVISDIEVDDPDLGAAFTLAATDFGTGGWTTTPIYDLEDCAVIMPRRDLAPGERVSFRIEAAIEPALTGSQGQSSEVRFNIRAGLGDLSAPVTPQGCPTVAGVIPLVPASGGTIASTGAQSPEGALVLAGMALGGGWLLILAARRKRREKETNA